VACLVQKPIVDGIEREKGDRLQVIRLNYLEPVGREMGQRLGFRSTPTFIVFDAQGREVGRTVGMLDRSLVDRVAP
jgi:thioredoxin-related protein